MAKQSDVKNIETEKFIKNLEATATYKNINKGFKWDNIPRFAIITGENGSGKTALLEQIDKIHSLLEPYKSNNQKYIFNNHINSYIKYLDTFTLANKHYTYNNTSKTTLKNLYRQVTDLRKDNNLFKIFERYLKEHHNRGITFEDFVTGNFRDFSPQEQIMLKQWRENFSVSLRQYAAFFKRHNITEDKFVLMSQDEFDQWLDSIYDTNIESKPIIFDEQLLINIYGEYFINFENYKRDLEISNPEKQVKEIYEMVEKRIGKNPLDTINKQLEKCYSKYKIDITKDLNNTLNFICRDRENQEIKIPLNELSLGEQLIISLFLWQYDKNVIDSTILLLDEPDSHLNPKMTKTLIDTLKNSVVKELDCQIIMTTHSLSSVAYCDEEDLFFMENGKIRKISKPEAIQRLSDGVMTFDVAMNTIRQIQESTKPTLMVEGKLDKLHIENFYKLSNKEILFEIIECNGADNMKHFLIVFQQLNISKEKILFLCDYDDKGKSNECKIKEKGYSAIFTLDIESLLQSDDRIRLKNYPIEMLYPLDVLQKYGLVNEISMDIFIKDLGRERQKEVTKNYENDLSTNKAKWEIKNDSKAKLNFAQKEIQELSFPQDFEEIKSLTQRIEKHFNHT